MTCAKIEFYDTNFWIGENNLSEKLTVPEYSAEDIFAERLAKFNISGHLIAHYSSLFCSPEDGNDLMGAFLGKHNSKNSVKTKIVSGMLFMEMEYFKNPDLFAVELRKRYAQGFRCIKLVPKSHKYPFDAALMKNIYRVLNDCRFPVMISLDELDITGNKYIEWAKILEVANTFENMPVIIDGGNSKELMFSSYIFLLLQNSSNVYFNTHNLFSVNQIENIAGFGGPDRLVFDSYFPYYETFLSVERIVESDLKDEQKRKIAGLNIKRIFDGINLREE